MLNNYSKISKVFSIAQAVVDVAIQITDKELEKLGYKKGAYRKISDLELNELLHLFQERDQTITPGGAVANSIDLIQAFGISTTLLTGIGDDKHGRLFESAYRKRGTDIFNIGFSGRSTGTSVVLVTPDGERTMSTHLGASDEFSCTAIKEIEIPAQALFLLEGYVLREGFGEGTIRILQDILAKVKENGGLNVLALPPVSVQRALESAISEVLPLCTAVHGNKEEFFELYKVRSLNDLFEALRECQLSAVITDGSEGAIAVAQTGIVQVPADKVNVVDLTGAGDAFLAGWITGALMGLSTEDCLKKGSALAAKIIGTIGARLY